jgi:phosphoribosylformylglycinamidine synthase
MPAKGDLVLIGETEGWLGQSLWLREIAGREEGAPPPVDLAAERRNGDFVRGRILAGEVLASHDCADGGLLVALAEMAMGSGIGAKLAPAPEGIPAHGFWFGEDQARYVLAVADGAALIAKASAAGVPARLIGSAGGGDLVLPDGAAISVLKLAAAHEATLPALMGES